jgi:thiamine kinase-like enzyme
MAAAAALGVAPEVLYADGTTGAFVTRAAPGRPLDPKDAGALMRIGRTLARLHAGHGFAGALDPAVAAVRYAEALGNDDSRALARKGAALWAALAPGRGLAPCHNDPVPANVIDDGRRALLVDWEFAGLNDPAWDLAYLAVEGELDEAGLDRLLEAHGADRAFAARVRASRAMVLLVNGLWCRLKGEDAAEERIARFRAMVDSDAFRRQSRVAISGGAP